MKVRVVFSKEPQLRWISHLDLVKTLEKALRRAQAPLALSQGFNPRPKMSIGAPLALGLSSKGEILEFELAERIDLPSLQKKINEELPCGLEFLKVYEVAEKGPSLMSLVTASHYTIVFYLEELMPQIIEAVKSINEKEELIFQLQQKSGVKEEDLKPGIFSLFAQVEKDTFILNAVLETSSTRFIRPNYIVDLINEYLDEPMQLEDYLIQREKILLKLV